LAEHTPAGLLPFLALASFLAKVGCISTKDKGAYKQGKDN